MTARAIKIAITAMGGQGGGVLANWIVKLGEMSGFIPQMTSVPGVAQRTGATVYYVELFPVHAAKAAGKEPVLALMPAPGDVDIVIAAELMEAGRAVKRGFVGNATTVIASTHRDYAISEKIGLGDARQSGDEVLAIVKEAAGAFVGADMAAAASEAGTVISSVLFGALAGAHALPIEQKHFENVIRLSGRAVESNLLGFSKGFGIAQGSGGSTIVHVEERIAAIEPSPEVEPMVDRIRCKFPASTHYYMLEGLERTIDFQDIRYGNEYLDRLSAVLEFDESLGGVKRDYLLTQTVSKHLALWMTFEDIVRVADLKTRSSRFSRFRDDVRAVEEQIVEIKEYMHPRVEEACDLLPPFWARRILGSDKMRAVVKWVLGDGRRVSTTSLRGFLPLYVLGSLRGIRRASYRFHCEHLRIDQWLSLVKEAADSDYSFGVSVATMQRLIKGYGETYERGLASFSQIAAVLPAIKEHKSSVGIINTLINAALQDENGVALTAALKDWRASNEQAA